MDEERKDRMVSFFCDFYGKLPSNGKPQSEGEFAILAGLIVSWPTVKQNKSSASLSTDCESSSPTAADHSRDKERTIEEEGEEYAVLALATGTRSANSDLIDSAGAVLADGHAEVLARRAFQHFLLETLLLLESSPSSSLIQKDPLCILERSCSVSPQDSGLRPGVSAASRYRLKEGYSLHLVVSDAPCGDAAIYPVQHLPPATSSDQNDVKAIMNFTGAKRLLCSTEAKPEGDGTSIVFEREGGDQVCGCLRIKPGRSDINNRSLSMSCSDKIARWIVLGLQGRLLSSWVGLVPLSSVIVMADPKSDPAFQLKPLRRALVDRLLPIQPIRPLSISVSDLWTAFPHGKAAVSLKAESNVISQSQSEALAGGDEEKSGSAGDPPAKRRRNKKEINPASTSLNYCLRPNRLWLDGFSDTVDSKRRHGLKPLLLGDVEVVIGKEGRLQGSTKKRRTSPLDHPVPCDNNREGINRSASLSLGDPFCSRLSRAKLREKHCELFSLKTSHPKLESDTESFLVNDYKEWKRSVCFGGKLVSEGNEGESSLGASADYLQREKEFFSHPLFRHWLR
eukprot:gene10300-11400_t